MMRRTILFLNVLDNEQYLCLLLVVYEHLEPLYKLFSDIPPKAIQETDGVKFVVFDIPLPEFPLSNEQIVELMKVAPDKQMPSALIQMKHFLKSHSWRVTTSGSNALPLNFVQQQAKQLELMMLSVRVQYEQDNGDAFPLN